MEKLRSSQAYEVTCGSTTTVATCTDEEDISPLNGNDEVDEKHQLLSSNTKYGVSPSYSTICSSAEVNGSTIPSVTKVSENSHTTKSRWFSRVTMRQSEGLDQSASFIRRKMVWSFMRKRVDSFVVHEHKNIRKNASNGDVENGGGGEQDLRTSVNKAVETADFKFWECFLAIFFYLMLGVVAYSYIFEKWSIVDSLYFSVVTFTTVGYGDIYPATMGGRLFNAFFALGGIAFLGVALGRIGNRLIEAHATALEKANQRRQVNVASFLEWTDVAAGRDSTASSDVTQEESSTSNNNDNESTGFNKVMECFTDVSRPFIAFFSAFLVLMIGSAVISWTEGWNWAETLYFVIITASTVGYGDIAPSNAAGRWCCVIFIPLSVGVMGVVLGQVAKAMMQDRLEAALDKITECRITMEDFHSIDSDKSGTVCRKEFVDFMLVKMNLVDQGCLNKIHEQFDSLDFDKNGLIEKSDLIKRAKQKNKDVRYKLELAAYKGKLLEKAREQREKQSLDIAEETGVPIKR